MPRLPGAGELVRFARKLYHYGRHFAELEGAEHFLPTRPGWSAGIAFAEHEHHRRLHVLNITDGRARLEIVGIIEGRHPAKFADHRSRRNRTGLFRKSRVCPRLVTRSE